MSNIDDTNLSGTDGLGGQPSDLDADANPVDAAAESKQTVTNDAVAGEPVEGTSEADDPGLVEPIEGVGDDEENRAEFDATDGLAEDAPDQIQADPDGDVANR